MLVRNTSLFLNLYRYLMGSYQYMSSNSTWVIFLDHIYQAGRRQ